MAAVVGRSTRSLGRMSIVVAIRRSGQPFEAAELERVAAAHRDLSLTTSHLTWIGPSKEDPITLNITPDEIWTDDPRSTVGGALDFLRSLAKELRGEVYCEGEPLADEGTLETQQSATPAKTFLGVLGVMLAAPFLLVWVIIRLPWVLWQIKRRTK
jgi:hypothetical protein